jgi:hypothetical protein
MHTVSVDTSGVTQMKRTALFSLISGSLVLAGPAAAQNYTFVSLDVHCPATSAPAACPAGLTPGQVAASTAARGINAQGDIVGSYVAVAGARTRGFLLKDGKHTTLEFPVAGVRGTSATGINPRGEIVGNYAPPVHDPNNPPPEDSPLFCPSSTSAACTKGFHYWNGQFTTVMFPVATFDESDVDNEPGHDKQPHKRPAALAQRITPDGDIYGCLHDRNTGPSMFGVAWTRAGAFSLTQGGGQLSDPNVAVPMSMSNGATPGGDTVVGFFADMDNVQHGYLVRNGELESYDPTVNTNLSAIWDINPSKHFVGTFRETSEPDGKRHAFVQSLVDFLQNPDDPNPVTFDFTCQAPGGCAGQPSGTVAFATVAFGINPDGVIVGQYLFTTGGAHGFIAIPPDEN